MEIKGNRVKLTRRERRSMGWPRGYKLFIEDIPVHQERDLRTFNRVADRLNNEESLVGTMEGVSLAQLENRALVYSRAISAVIDRDLHRLIDGEIQTLPENQEVKI